ncbi:hypothetical protein DBT_0705 [Dissulfuribacter thermophilus]|uniref:Cell division protein ZapA n=1 Tax=Dissulfuribacter thermophilus TaxID=1156395 RepID=A0A1B9F7B1_9BACT|nr:cell division protein ZapA [Dissulfuribacter thermophilus]OCC15780.1 hypothetical protein DBT_0705 [Dissulfuribacter thermophilus]
MQDGPKVRLEFFGHSYYLTQREEEDIDLKDLVSYVERVARDVSSSHSNLPAHKQIVLTVLSIAKDYFSAQKELQVLEERIETLLKNISTYCN